MRRPPIARLEDLTKGALVSGNLADHAVTVIDVTWLGATIEEALPSIFDAPP